MNDKTNNSNNNTKRIKEKTGKTNLRFNSKSHSIPKFALELDIQLEVSSFHKRCNASVHADKSEKEIENNDEKMQRRMKMETKVAGPPWILR